jgi:hydroxymethylbilane synthase
VSHRRFVVGSRGSPLAQRQTQIALHPIRRAHPGIALELRAVRTAGDRSRASLAEIGGRGVFVAEIERALLDGEIDIAVHSLKDMLSRPTDGLAIAAVVERADPRDALVSRNGETLAGLPPGATVGTGSPRRAAQLLAARPDLRVAGIRGNVDTRVRKVDDGDYDATVLAAAGLARLDLLDRASELLPPEVMLPAVGQGALAVQVRAGDQEAIDLVAAADDPATHRATAAERAFEAHLGGGCHAAIAAYSVVSPLALSPPKREAPDAARKSEAPLPARPEASLPARPEPVEGASRATIAGGTLHLRGLVAAPDGSELLRGEIEGAVEDAEPLGVELAEALLARGAARLLEAVAS